MVIGDDENKEKNMNGINDDDDIENDVQNA